MAEGGKGVISKDSGKTMVELLSSGDFLLKIDQGGKRRGLIGPGGQRDTV